MDASIQSKAAFKRAVEVVGSQEKMAVALSQKLGRPVSQSYVWNQLHQRKGPIASEIAIPVEQILKEHKEKLTEMEVITRHDLRPDLYPK